MGAECFQYESLKSLRSVFVLRLFYGVSVKNGMHTIFTGFECSKSFDRLYQV